MGQGDYKNITYETIQDLDFQKNSTNKRSMNRNSIACLKRPTRDDQVVCHVWNVNPKPLLILIHDQSIYILA